jgi:hypothetical protein
MLKSGTAQTKASNSETVKKQSQQLRSSGKVRDAAALFENLI